MGTDNTKLTITFWPELAFGINIPLTLSDAEIIEKITATLPTIRAYTRGVTA